MENFPVCFIAEVQLFAFDGAHFGHGRALAVRFRQIQQPENFVRGSHSVHGNVEIGAQDAHGQEEVCRQKDDENTPGQVYPACPELGGSKNHTQSRTAVGNQVHNGDGIELHGQNLHSDFAEMLALLIHFPVLEGICPVDLCGGQTLEVFQEGVAQGCVFAPIFGKKLFRPPLNGNDGHRNQGYAN